MWFSLPLYIVQVILVCGVIGIFGFMLLWKLDRKIGTAFEEVECLWHRILYMFYGAMTVGFYLDSISWEKAYFLWRGNTSCFYG